MSGPAAAGGGGGPAAAGGGGGRVGGPRSAAIAGDLKRKRDQAEYDRAEKVDEDYARQCLAGRPTWNGSPPRVGGQNLKVSKIAESGAGGRSAKAAHLRGCTSRGEMYGGINDKTALREIWAGIDDQESKNCCLCGFPLYNEHESFFNGSETRMKNMGQTSPEHFIALSRYGATLIGIPMKGEILTDDKKRLYRKNLKKSHLYCNYQKRQLQFITWPEDDDYPKLVNNLDIQLNRLCNTLLRGDAGLRNGSHAVLNPLKGDFKAHSNIPRYFIRYYMCNNPNDDIELELKIKEWKLNTINRLKVILNNIIDTLKTITSQDLKLRYSQLLEGKISAIPLINVPLDLTEIHFPTILQTQKDAGIANAFRVRRQILNERIRVGGGGGGADAGGDAGGGGGGGGRGLAARASGLIAGLGAMFGAGGAGGAENQRKRTRRRKNHKRQTRKR
jgi:hypothetical protein